jgi:glycosyltransferase involved in cell wall biosynthesis
MAAEIVKIIADHGFRSQMSKNAITWAKRFDWDKSADEFEKILVT